MVIAISLLNTLLSQYNVFFFMFFNENLFIIENTTMQYEKFKFLTTMLQFYWKQFLVKITEHFHLIFD